MIESIGPPSLSNAVDRPGLPPLRIHHFLAWTAATAVLITASMWFDRTARNGPAIESRVVVGSLILLAVAVSGALTCVGWGLYWRRHGYAFPKEPGDWLLTWVAAVVVSALAMLAGIFIVFYIEEDWLETFDLIGVIALFVLLFGLCVKGAIRSCDTGAWRILFALLSVLPLIVGLTGMTIAACVVLASLLWATWNDRRHEFARHWAHWFGVIVLFSLVCVMIGLGN